MSTCRVLYDGELWQPIDLLPFSNLLADEKAKFRYSITDALRLTHVSTPSIGEKSSLFGVRAERHRLHVFREHRLDEMVPYAGTIQLGLGWNEGLMMFERMEIVALQDGYLVPL